MKYLRRPRRPDKTKAAGDQPAAFGNDQSKDDTGKSNRAHAPFQGRGNARWPSQSGPRWGPTRGQAALDALDKLWGPPRRPIKRGRS